MVYARAKEKWLVYILVYIYRGMVSAEVSDIYYTRGVYRERLITRPTAGARDESVINHAIARARADAENRCRKKREPRMEGDVCVKWIVCKLSCFELAVLLVIRCEMG